MIRGDVDVALDKVLVQCESNARRFRYTGELLANETEAQLLYRLADQRDALASEVRHELRQRGELPDTVDVERQTLQELKDRITAALAREGRKMVLLERVEDEERLAAAAAAALDLRLPEECRAVLERVRKEAEYGAEHLRTTCDRVTP
ncbi:MAG: hypothetical protein WED00_09195 [Aquisalimonadaceae bacterium]